MTLMIGAPVFRREWIIEQWFDYMFVALDRAGITDYTFSFVGDYRDPTFEILNEIGEQHKVYTRNVPEGNLKQRWHTWNHEAYEKMVSLRNNLLYFPRNMQPDFFLSADTDILVHPDSISNLLESCERFDAVAGKVYLTPHGKHHPSYANLGRTGALVRKDATGVFPVEIIMALKMMTPKAYVMDYMWHKHGEDIGWSLNCKRVGLKLGFDGRVGNKHVMEENMLDRVDQRVGY